MAPPLLKLSFVKGPKDGESLQYKPGSTIRIGRVVRGNEIAVKDAGVSTKHLRIVSDSENWIIHDLGSSNGTILNSETLDPDTPVNLRHGDVIKLGEYTSIVVNFETDAQVVEEEEEEEERKLPPRPRRNNRRFPVSDPDPVPIDSVQEKPKRRGRPPKNEKKVAITSEEEEAVPVEKGGKIRARRDNNKNAEDVQGLSLNSVKLEVEDTPKGVERVTRRSRQIRDVKCEDDVMEEKRRPSSRATRSTAKKEIGGDSFQELEIVLNQARKSRAKKKTVEQKVPEGVVEEMGGRNEDVGDEKGSSETSDKEDERVEEVDNESRKGAVVGEEDLDCGVREDGETENLQEEKDSKVEEGGVETSDGGCDEEEKAEQGMVDLEKIDLEKMTLGDWFEYMKVHLRKRIVDKTEKMIEDMRSKSLRVHHHIAEQKQAKGKGSVS
ncbi:FHA domain-containing protein At4g14490-like [Raphanus sativus]|uniref:FHA domain-containing protein At4g14490-like n=1 Tax=Raphanus sativus TaxID=3726 RepID=A0A6J0K105_RAPSA|nr:FHA domain-containing protein At4g14490-like [Raphanus sativus]XP_056845709.1 FHA domain-containing protein At4g14490-like [Raphanus sativus]